MLERRTPGSSARQVSRRVGGSSPAQFEARFFGPFRVVREGTPVQDAEFGRASARTLLKWFLLNPGVRLQAGEMCRMLSPGRAPVNSAHRAHVAVHHLRHVLQPELPARKPSTFIRSDGAGLYWFDPAGCWWTDTDEVGQLLGEARAAERRGDVDRAIDLYERALAHYAIGFLPEDVFDEMFDTARAAHEVAHTETYARLLALYLRAGLDQKALTCALSMMGRDPFSEDAVVAIVEVNLRQGNLLAARMELTEYLRNLSSGLGVTPSPCVVELWKRLCGGH